MPNKYLPSKEALIAFFKNHKFITNPKEPINAALRYAVWAGKIKKPTACSKCGNDKVRICGHHHKVYSKKHALDVIWLCDRCHTDIHYR